MASEHEIDSMIDAVFGAAEVLAEQDNFTSREMLAVLSAVALRWAQTRDISPADYVMLQATIVAETTGAGETGKQALLKGMMQFAKRKEIR